VVWIVDQLGVLVDEDRLGLFEADAMLLRVGCGLSLIPLEVKRAHVAV